MNKSIVVRKNNKTQTKLHVYPHILRPNESAKVLTRRGTQTVITLSPLISTLYILPLLEYLPYREISLNCIREIKLPHKSRLTWLINSSDNIIFSKKMKLNDADVQTELSVTPHVLDEDAMAVVLKEIDVQTSLTFTPSASLNGVLTKLRTNLDHMETFNNEEVEMNTTEDEMDEIRNVENRIAMMLDEAVLNLQERLNNIMNIYGTSEELEEDPEKLKQILDDLNEMPLEEEENEDVTAQEMKGIREESADANDSKEFLFPTEQGIGDNVIEDPDRTTLGSASVAHDNTEKDSTVYPEIFVPGMIKEGHKHGAVQTEEIMFNCTGTNYDSGDDQVKRFTDEGVGTMEFACQCSEKVNAAAQDGTVEIIPIETPLEKAPVNTDDSSKVGVSEDGNFVGCTCVSSGSTLDELIQKEPSHHAITESLESDDDLIPCTCVKPEYKIDDVSDKTDSDDTFISFDCTTSTPMKTCKYATHGNCCNMIPKIIFEQQQMENEDKNETVQKSKEETVEDGSTISFDCPTSTPTKQSKHVRKTDDSKPNDIQFVSLPYNATEDESSTYTKSFDRLTKKIADEKKLMKTEGINIRKDRYMEVDAAPKPAAQKVTNEYTEIPLEQLDDMIEDDNNDDDLLNTAINIENDDEPNKEKLTETPLITCNCTDRISKDLAEKEVQVSLRSLENNRNDEIAASDKSSTEDNVNNETESVKSSKESFVFNLNVDNEYNASKSTEDSQLKPDESTENTSLSQECVDSCTKVTEEEINASYVCTCNPDKEELVTDDTEKGEKINKSDTTEDDSEVCTCVEDTEELLLTSDLDEVKNINITDLTEDDSEVCTCLEDTEQLLTGDLEEVEDINISDLNEDDSVACTCLEDTEELLTGNLEEIKDVNKSDAVEDDFVACTCIEDAEEMLTGDQEEVNDINKSDSREDDSVACSCIEDAEELPTSDLEEVKDINKSNLTEDDSFVCTCSQDNTQLLTGDLEEVKVINKSDPTEDDSFVCTCSLDDEELITGSLKEVKDIDISDSTDSDSMLYTSIEGNEELQIDNLEGTKIVNQSCQTSDELLSCSCTKNQELVEIGNDFAQGISTHTIDCLHANICNDILDTKSCNCEDEEEKVEELYVTSITSTSDEECKCCKDSNIDECRCPSTETTSMILLPVDEKLNETSGKNNDFGLSCECGKTDKADISLQTSIVTVGSHDNSARLTSSITVCTNDASEDLTEIFTRNDENLPLLQEVSVESFVCDCDYVDDDPLPPERQLFLEDIISMKSPSNQSFICDCMGDDYIELLQKDSSFVSCNDDYCPGEEDKISIVNNLETGPIGDYADVKRPIHILCECTPNVEGAAPPFLFEKDPSAPIEIGPQVQSLERLCNENPNNIEAFMQRLRDMAPTKEGKEYIRNLCPETIAFLYNAGYEEELKLLMSSSAPSFYIFKEDPIYFESYFAGLEINRSIDAVVRSDYSLVDDTEAGECTDGVEMPWYKIKLPEAGTYEIKPRKPHQQESLLETIDQEYVPQYNDLSEGTSKDIGQREDVGQNEDVGQSEDVGQREDISQSEYVGQSEDVGQSKDVSPSEDVNGSESVNKSADVGSAKDVDASEDVGGNEDINDNVDKNEDIDVGGNKSIDGSKEEGGSKIEDEIKSSANVEGVSLAVPEGKIERKQPEDRVDDSKSEPFDPERDCIETYKRKFRLLVDTQTIYYHEPQYASLYEQYESEEEEECTESLVIHWKDIMLRTNATIIPTKDVPVPNLEAIAKTSELVKTQGPQEKDPECICSSCPAVEALLKKYENKVPEPEPEPEPKPVVQAAVAIQVVGLNQPEVNCECNDDIKKPPAEPTIQEEKVCAANKPRQLNCSLENKEKSQESDTYNKDCIANKCPSIPDVIQKLYEDKCTCKPSPKFCTCATIEDKTDPQVQIVELPQIVETPRASEKSSRRQLSKDLLEKSNCLCIAGKKMEKYKKAYCSAHTCHQLNANYFTNATKEEYDVDECNCRTIEKFNSDGTACYSCNMTPKDALKGNINVTKTQYQKTISQLMFPTKTVDSPNNQVALIAQHMHLVPINTKSLCNSSANQPLDIKIRTISMPQIDKHLMKEPYTTKDVQCQCNEMSKLVDECICTDTTTQINVNNNKCISVEDKCPNKDPVFAALAAYQAEMQPLRDALCQLREKIRSLNLNDKNAPKSSGNVDDLYKTYFPTNTSECATTSSSSTPMNNAYKVQNNAQNIDDRNMRSHVNSAFYHPGLIPGLNPALPTYFTGLYPPYNHNLRYPNYAFQPYPIPQPDFPNFNFNLQKPKQKENQMRKMNNNNANVNHPEISSTSLKTTTTQTKQKKRDRKKKKLNVSPSSSSDTSEQSIINIASSSSNFPVKEEKAQVEKNLDVRYGPDGSQRTDIGPAFVDVRAVESGGKYNLKIALKMKPPDTNLVLLQNTKSSSSRNTPQNISPKISFHKKV